LGEINPIEMQKLRSEAEEAAEKRPYAVNDSLVVFSAACNGRPSNQVEFAKLDRAA
jgi:hypothetical protein